MVGDLEQVHRRQTLREQARIYVLFDVTGKQEPAVADLAEQHDRHVVDPAAGVGRLHRHLPADRPQHAHRDLVHGQSVTRRDRQVDWRPRSCQSSKPGGVAGSWPAHPGLQHALDPVAVEQQRQPRDMVLMGVRQDDHIDPAVPRRDPPIELDEQPIRIRSAVDQHSTTARPLDEDRVALSHVQDRHPDDAAGPGDRHGTGHRHRHDEATDRKTRRPRGG